jgi:hypothetical protein
MFRAALIAITFPTSGLACMVQAPFQPTDLAAGPVVLAGTVTAYHRDDDYSGHLTVALSALLKGEAPAIVELVWSPNLSETAPGLWDRGQSIILAAVPPQDGLGWQVAVELCGDAWILPDTPGYRAIVANAIAEAT